MYTENFYNKENFVKKIDNAIEFRYKSEKNNTLRKCNSAFYSDFKEKYPESDFDIAQALRYWRNFCESTKTRLPTLKQLIQICNVLDCDIDYFLTEQSVLRKNIGKTSQEMGFRYTTIENLLNLSDSEKHIIDSLFDKNTVSIDIVKTIKEMLFYSHPLTKNKAHIVLDKNLTERDIDYQNLEKELNENEVIDILSYRLVNEMHEILRQLGKNEMLSIEICQDYEKKFFKEHKKILSASDLPQLGDIDDKIYRTEQKILDRLKDREDNGNYFNYNIEWLRSRSDFVEKIQKYRLEMTKEEYIAWLDEVDSRTK